MLDERGGKLDLGEELDIGPLGKLPPREECPICMRVMPIHPKLHAYATCCGKTICGGCNLQHIIKSKELAAESFQTPAPYACPFCRTVVRRSDEERLAQLRKRVELKDPTAMWHLSAHYDRGGLGLPVDQAKCIELLRQSSDLGCHSSQYQLGYYYHNGEMGLEQNDEEALNYWGKAAEGGDLMSRHNLGYMACKSDDSVAAMRHLRLSASGGHRGSMSIITGFFKEGCIHHADLAETLQAFYRAGAELRSEERDQFIAYKERGEVPQILQQRRNGFREMRQMAERTEILLEIVQLLRASYNI